MFTVTVRDQMMVAHSLRGEVFGPAQRLHGATYVVEATFAAADLDPHGIVVDLGRAATALHDVLDTWNYRNLDDDAGLAGVNTTTEVLARTVADRLAERIEAGALAPSGALSSLTITLRESPSAWATYTRNLPGGPPGATP